MFSKDDIDKSIVVIYGVIDFIRTTDPKATAEIEYLENSIASLEAYHDLDKFWAQFSEKERLMLLGIDS